MTSSNEQLARDIEILTNFGGEIGTAALEPSMTKRILAALRTPPAVEPDEGLVCGENGKLCSACDLPAHELTQVPGCGAPLRNTPSIRAQALEEAAKCADAEFEYAATQDGGQAFGAQAASLRIAARIRALKGGQGV